MPAGDLTNANVGVAVPLCYGYVRVTGNEAAFTTVPASTTSETEAYPLLQVGIYLGGEGEWDGPDSLFIKGNRMFAYDVNGNRIGPNPTTGTIPADGGSADTSLIVGTLYAFNFHPGVDAGLSGATVAEQDFDPLWSFFEGVVTPLCYTRIAYWGIGWTPQINGDQSKMQPICDMRTMKCRIFDATGTQIDYRFTTNPVWHIVDSWLRRAIKPQWTIDASTGPAALTASEIGCFRWDIIAESAAYCDEILTATGTPRFEGSYAFSAGTTLAAMHEQMLLCCRGYQREIAGKIAIFVDRPRSSGFTATGEMLIPGSFIADDTLLHKNANRYIATYLETGLPAVSTISTISRTGGVVTINTVETNPCIANDLIIVGGVEDDSFNQAYLVTANTSGVITAPTAATDTSSSTGGSIGYLESRFSQRTPEAPAHIQHQLAIGQVMPPAAGGQRLKRVKVSYDYASSTWDQAMRLLLYERYRDLGADAAPYQPPVRVSLTLWSEAVDASGNILWELGPGDVITLDATTFYEFAGDYEIQEFIPHPLQVNPQQQGGTFITEPAANSGTISLVLWSFQPDAFTDTSGVANASFATVPGAFLYGGTSGGTWALLTGTLTVSAPTPTGPYEGYTITVSWTGITASMPDGSVMHYSDGSVAFLSFYTGTFYLVDAITGMGDGVCVPSGPSTPSIPSGAHVLYTGLTNPIGTTTTYTL